MAVELCRPPDPNGSYLHGGLITFLPSWPFVDAPVESFHPNINGMAAWGAWINNAVS